MGILVFNVIIHIKWQPTSKEIWQMQSKMLNVNDTLVTLYANVGYNVVILVRKNLGKLNWWMSWEQDI